MSEPRPVVTPEPVPAAAPEKKAETLPVTGAADMTPWAFGAAGLMLLGAAGITRAAFRRK